MQSPLFYHRGGGFLSHFNFHHHEFYLSPYDMKTDDLGADKKWSGRSRRPLWRVLLVELISPPVNKSPSETIFIWQQSQTHFILFSSSFLIRKVLDASEDGFELTIKMQDASLPADPPQLCGQIGQFEVDLLHI